MKVIGLTGSLASGKSTVAVVFRKLGAVVINADTIAHKLIAPGGRCEKKVIKAFGPGILTRARIDRKKLAGIVFQKPRELKKLERIIHPAVARVIRYDLHKFKGTERKVVLEVPLLFEAGLDRLADVTLTVTSAQPKQLARARKHYGMGRAEALRRIKSQMPLGKKVQFSDLTIDNNGTKKQTEKQVKSLWQKL